MSEERSHELERRDGKTPSVRPGAAADDSQRLVEFAPGGEPTFMPLDTQPATPEKPAKPAHQRPASAVFDGAIKANHDGSSRRMDLSGGSGSNAGQSNAASSKPGSSLSGKRPSLADDQTQISKRPPLTPTPGGSLLAVDSHRELEGQRLEHFELQELVGGGGMGAVFRAIDTRLNRVVALKILAQDQAIDEEKIRRFRNEAQSAARLDHENVARVYYVGEDRGLHFIAFEFIPGTNVRDLVESRGPLPIDDAITYTYQIAEALAHATSRDVVHRDIKPSNIIITEEGRAKLVDMGLARLHADDRSSKDLTASGVTLGTFDYISPEQALDPRNADARSDIYSLGCTIYFMLTGRPPFPEGSPLQKLLHHHSEKPPDPRALNHTIPDDLAALVQRMMAKDPAARPATPKLLVQQLAEIAQELGFALPLNGGTLAAPSRRFRFSLERQLPWLVPVSALLVVVAIVEALAIWPSGGTQTASGPPPRPWNVEQARQDSTHSDPAAGAAGQSSRNAATPSTDNSKTTSPAGATNPNGVGTLTPPSGASGQSQGDGRTSPSSAGSDAVRATTSTAGSRDNEPSGASPSTTASALANIPSTSGAAKAGSGAGISTAPSTSNPSVGDRPVSPLDVEANQAEAAAESDPDQFFPAFDATADAAPPIDVRVPAFDPTGASSDSVSGERNPSTVATSRSVNSPLPTAGGPGLRIVDPTQIGAYIYPTLRAACAAAQDGDVIELRFDGVRAERPIESRNRRLTIRAGENNHPIIRFCPTEDDPLKHPRRMVTVAGGRLTLVNLVLELDLSLARPAEGWSLFELHQAELVRLERCVLTIRNTSESGGAQHADVSFFEVDAPPGTSGMVMMQDPAPAFPIALELQDSVARGEGVFVRVNDLQPVSLNWQNGFLATGQRLLVTLGGAKQPQHLGKVQLELRHLTLAVGDGLCLLTNSADLPYQLSTQIRCTDSIVVSRSQGALIEQSGIDTVSDFRARLKWESERDFYDGFSVFWKIRGKSASATVEEMTLSPWNAFWGGRERSWGRVVWREPPDLSRPPHLQTVSDFELDQRVADNPARRGASDGRDAGCEASLLPAFPEIQFGSEAVDGTNSPRTGEQGAAGNLPDFR